VRAKRKSDDSGEQNFVAPDVRALTGSAGFPSLGLDPARTISRLLKKSR
jgi:hypothetical protein